MAEMLLFWGTGEEGIPGNAAPTLGRGEAAPIVCGDIPGGVPKTKGLRIGDRGTGVVFSRRARGGRRSDFATAGVSRARVTSFLIGRSTSATGGSSTPAPSNARAAENETRDKPAAAKIAALTCGTGHTPEPPASSSVSCQSEALSFCSPAPPAARVLSSVEIFRKMSRQRRSKNQPRTLPSSSNPPKISPTRGLKPVVKSTATVATANPFAIERRKKAQVRCRRWNPHKRKSEGAESSGRVMPGENSQIP